MMILSFRSLLSLVVSLSIVSAYTLPLPTPAPVPLQKRDSCNQDNCLRALEHNSLSASPFCSTYTESSVTATTAIPAYATSGCANLPSRVSSACSCLNTPLASACYPDAPTQVVQTPGFECPTPNGSIDSQTYGPWSIKDQTAPGYPYGPEGDIYCGSGEWAYEGNAVAYFYGYIGANGNNIAFNGLATVEQSITYCPNTKYAFSAYVGYYDQSIPVQLFNTTVTVTLDGQTIVPTQLTCSSIADCPLPVRSGIGGYRQITGSIITPYQTTSTLRIIFDFSSTGPGGTPPLYGTVLDLVTLTLAT